MLKPVPIGRIKPGMWFHRLGGAGYHHAFVKRGFLLEARDIEVLASGGIDELIIDTELGLDVEDDAVAPSPDAVPPSPDAVPSSPDAVPPSPDAVPPSPDAVPPSPDAVPPSPDEAPVLSAEPERAVTEPPVSAGASGVAAEPGPTVPPPPAAPLAPREAMNEEMHKARQLYREGKEKVISLFSDARLGKAIEPEAVMPLVEQISESVSRHPDALVSVVRLKSHDEYTYMHSVAVCALMVSLARRLGLPEDRVRDAGAAGMLHDLGKAAMPLEVLNKPGALTDDEFRVMKAHPIRGWEMLKTGGETPESVLDVVLHHHEKFDGTGYPHGLGGDDISLMARMGSVCDVYDAITSNRPYKKAWGPAESLQRMFSWKGHFDEVVLKSFIRSVGIYPVGALVRLESDRLAVVIEQTEGSLLTPRVRVFFNARKRMPVFIKDLDLAAPDCGDRVVGLESPDKWNFAQLDRLWTSQ